MFRVNSLRVGIMVICLTFLTGCGGGGGENPTVTLEKQSHVKLTAMKELASAVAKNDPAAILGAVETLTASSIDVKAHPEVAKELVEIYKSKVKGKLKGDAAGQVQSVVEAIEKELK